MKRLLCELVKTADGEAMRIVMAKITGDDLVTMLAAIVQVAGKKLNPPTEDPEKIAMQGIVVLQAATELLERQLKSRN